jgi:hypothetical protein
MLNDGRELARFTGAGAKRQALRFVATANPLAHVLDSRWSTRTPRSSGGGVPVAIQSKRMTRTHPRCGDPEAIKHVAD